MIHQITNIVFGITIGGQGLDGSVLILTHETAIPFDIGTKNGSQFAWKVFLFHKRLFVQVQFRSHSKGRVMKVSMEPVWAQSEAEQLTYAVQCGPQKC